MNGLSKQSNQKTTDEKKETDVTHLIDYSQINDGEYLVLTKCVCGKPIYDSFDGGISIYGKNIDPMPCCGRKLYFSMSVKVYEVE